MDRVPPLWSAAYGSRRPSVRLLARLVVRAGELVRELARADHTPSGGY
ncbi:hypothetical protein ABZ208_15695 [Streptomyces sp. NPDC006208]